MLLFFDEPFTPASIGGNSLAAWYDFSSSAYLTLSATAITQVLDRSGNGNHSDVQATGTKRPTFASNQLNGLPLATFDNGDTLVFTSKPSLFAIPADGNTIFVVAKRNSETGVTDQIYTMTEAGAGRNYIRFSATAGQINFISRAADASTVTSTGNTNTNYQIIRGRREGTTQAISVAGAAETTNASGQNETGVDAMYIGSRIDTDQYLDGGIGEILMYNRSLSTTEILQVEVYLANKWALYHPNATWILSYNSAKQAYIHANKLNKSDADADFAIVAAWYKMDSSSLTLVSTAITQMLDISGNDRHTDVQATTTRRPTYNSTGLNNRGTAEFATDNLALPSSLYSIPNGSNGVFAVANRTSATPAEADRIVTMSEGGGTRWHLSYSASADTVEFRSGTAVGTPVTVTGFTEASFNIFNSFRSGTTESLQVNNGTASTLSGGADENGIDAAMIGSNGIGTSLFLGGAIAELIICNTNPSATQIIRFNTYLSGQYNITIS